MYERMVKQQMSAKRGENSHVDIAELIALSELNALNGLIDIPPGWQKLWLLSQGSLLVIRLYCGEEVEEIILDGKS